MDSILGFKKAYSKICLNLVFIIAGSILSSAHATDGFHTLGRIHIGGDGGWDCLTVDSSARRLYLARANRITVVNVDSGQVVGEVQGLDGAHVVVIDKDLNRGFATSGNTNQVVQFDLNTFEMKARLGVGAKPDILILDNKLQRLFSFNGKDNSVNAIDPATFQIVGTLVLPGKPESAVSNNSGKIFVNIEDKNEVTVFDAAKLRLLTTVPIAGCTEPTGLAIDLKTNKLIIGCGNQQAVIMDSQSGKIQQTFRVGSGVDGVAFDAERNFAFISAGEGTLTVLSEDVGHFTALADVPTAKGARTLALDQQTGQVYLPYSQFSQLVPAPDGTRRRPSVKPGTFEILRVGM